MQFRDMVQWIQSLARRREFYYGVVGVLLSVGLLFLAGDASDAAKRRAQNYKLTTEAQRVSNLLDKQAYAAAEGILNAKLPQHPDDAGLHVQYARYLVLSRDVAYPGEVATPLYPAPDNLMYAIGAAQEAGERAMQLDADAGPYLAAVLMTALQEQITNDLDAGEGIIGGSWFGNTSGGLLEPDGFQTSMANAAWTALKADSSTAAAFAKDFRKLMEKAIELGKVSSAAMLGNLLGDLENEGKDNSRDFELACDAFERALANYAGPGKGPMGLELDWIEVTINWMRRIFQIELAAVTKGESLESYQRLEKALNARDLAVIETAEFREVLKERENARREAEERARRKALSPRIAEIKAQFTTEALSEVSDWERHEHEARIRKALKSWEGVVLFVSGWSHFDHSFTAAAEEAKELKEIAGLNVSIDDLRNDPRIGWLLSINGNTEEPSKAYTERMKRYRSYHVVKKRMAADNASQGSVRVFVDAVNQLIRFDETIGKYLVQAAELKRAKQMAMHGYGGAIWMTTLAEIAVAVEKGEAIVFNENGKLLELDKTGMSGYLLSLKVEPRDLSNKHSIDFDELFPQYVAAVRAGDDPAKGLGGQGFDFYKNRKR